MSKIGRDLILSFSSQLVYKLLGFAILALLARHLSKAEFGQLMFAIGLTGVAVLLTEFGSSTWLVREVAADPQRGLERTSEVFSVRLMLMLVYLVVVNAFAVWAKPDLLLVVLLTSVYIGLKDLYRSLASLFLGLRQIGYTVVVFGSSLLLQLVAIVAVIFSGGRLPAVLGSYLLMGGR